MNSETIVVVTVDRQQQLWLLDYSQKDLRYGPGSFFLEEALKMGQVGFAETLCLQRKALITD